MARAQADIGQAHYAVSLKAGQHALIADEATTMGGQDAGPSPYELLLASLGACTAITLKMYAGRKDWPLETLHVGLFFRTDGERPRIERTLRMEGLDDTQRARMADIAERTPVTLTLKGGLPITTELR
ncbi:MAG: OsmC family protein [Caulobacter sp.]|nr:OsmC family protein [Caulobacter sp.]